MHQTVLRRTVELPLLLMTAVAQHLVMSFAQTLIRCDHRRERIRFRNGN
jgi:hypothetical protein